jgi:N-acetylglucosaminyl-diphospho-decaprenol L-rhamnosyltransferase
MEQSPDQLDVAVAIVSYRTADMVAEALPPLLEELRAFARARVVIVDNDSPGEDADRMQAHLDAMGSPPEVRLVRSPRNGGFAAGNNVAFETLRADSAPPPDAVLLLNPDAVMKPGALQEMARVMAGGPRIGVVGARLENEDGSTWVAAFHFPSAMGEFARHLGIGAVQARWPVLARDMAAPGPVDWVSGAAMLVRWEMIEDIGGMDEAYFLYFEEIDYMRAAANAGWATWHAPAALVGHAAGGSTGIVDGAPKAGRMPGYWFESWSRYFIKNHGAGYARLAAALKLAGIGLGWMQRRLRGRQAGLTPHFLSDFARRCLLGGDGEGTAR